MRNKIPTQLYTTYRDKYIARDFVEASSPLDIRESYNALNKLLDESKELKDKVQAMLHINIKVPCPSCNCTGNLFCLKCLKFLQTNFQLPSIDLPVKLIMYIN